MRTRSIRAFKGRPYLLMMGLVIALCLALTGQALAAPGGIDVGIASGHPETLQADGVSRTVLEVWVTSLSDACWGGEIAGPGTFSLLASATGATVDPTMAVGVEFPAQLTVTAGKEGGTAEVKLQASWCPEDAVGVFGVCTDQKRGQSKCEAQISIPIGDAAPPPDPAKPPDRDDDGVPDADDDCPDQKGKNPDGCPDFEATLGCTPQNPVAGQPLSCSVSVQGARPGEQFQYVWYVDSSETARTTSPEWTWESATAGAHDVGVDVMGDARTLAKTVTVKVGADASSDDDGDGVPDDKDACRGQYGEGADGCPKSEAPPPAATTAARPFAPTVPTPSSRGVQSPATDDKEFDAFLRALEDTLAGGTGSAPTAGQAAAAGAVAGGGLATWLIAQILMDLLQTPPSTPAATAPAGTGASGTVPAGSKPAAPPGPTVQRIHDRDDAKQILQDAGILQDLRRLKRDDPQYWEKVDKTLEKVKNDRRVKAITYQQGPGGIDEDNIVIVVEEPEHRPAPPPPSPAPPAPVTPPPAAPTPAAPTEPVKPTPPKVKTDTPPPDITTLRDQRRKEVKDALERVKQLEELKKRLGQEYVRRRDHWESTRIKGVTHGVIDVADWFISMVTQLNKPFSIMPKWYDGVGTSYSKSHFKNLLKAAADQVVNWRMGKPVQMDPKRLYIDPLGIKPMPGGALKKVLTNISTRHLPGGDKLGAGYSSFESGYSLGKGTRDKMALTADLRKQMQHFHGRYLATDAQLREARDNLDTARNGLADVDRAIEQLRQSSPKFRDLGR